MFNLGHCVFIDKLQHVYFRCLGSFISENLEQNRSTSSPFPFCLKLFPKSKLGNTFLAILKVTLYSLNFIAPTPQ